MKEIESLLLLNMVPSLTPRLFHTLLEKFGSGKKIVNAGYSALVENREVTAQIARQILDREMCKKLDHELRLIKKHNIAILSFDDARYPAMLKQIADPPVVLYIMGNLTLLSDEHLKIAVVGSRRASLYGLVNAEKLSFQLASVGITVISGLARGIDTNAHRGSLEAEGNTVAVLGSGLLAVYPPENKELAVRISQRGALLSEFPLTREPFAKNFPRRNRIISGLSHGVVVVEAAKRSGALITADFALEQGREVFAVPGKINTLSAQGTHKLIQSGAKLVSSIEDIIEEFNLEVVSEKKESIHASARGLSLTLAENEMKIYQFLNEEKSFEEMFVQLSLPFGELTKLLCNLQLKHLIDELPGKRYIRKS